MDPLDWSANAWAAIAVSVTILLAAIGGMFKLRRDRRQAEPKLVFAPVQLFGPGEHPRTAYSYAVSFKVENVGPGVAINPVWQFQEPEDEFCSEIVHRSSIQPLGGDFFDFAGLRMEESPDTDLTREQAEDFYDRGGSILWCTDSLGRVWGWTPDGGKVMKKYGEMDHHTVLRHVSGFPSRGEPPKRWGK